MIRKAVIPAAGFGTRFLPATKSQPKEMLPIVDTPVIQYVVEEAVAAGITDVLMIIGKGKRSIEEHFDRSFQLESQLQAKGRTDDLDAMRRISDLADIHFVWQKEMRGLGDAVYCARHHVGDEPFVVLLGDTLIDSATPAAGQLAELYEQVHAPVVLLEQVEPERVRLYGIIDGQEVRPGVYRINDFVEKPRPERAPHPSDRPQSRRRDPAHRGPAGLGPGAADVRAQARRQTLRHRQQGRLHPNEHRIRAETRGHGGRPAPVHHAVG
jgi:UTP--glucose-1-phosphate uridylyltransferase